MSYYITAIYDHGLLKPLDPLAIPDQSRVRLRVEIDAAPESSASQCGEDGSAAEAAAQRRAMVELDAEIDGMPDLSPDDQFSSRDHDRVLYGGAT